MSVSSLEIVRGLREQADEFHMDPNYQPLYTAANLAIHYINAGGKLPEVISRNNLNPHEQAGLLFFVFRYYSENYLSPELKEAIKNPDAYQIAGEYLANNNDFFQVLDEKLEIMNPQPYDIYRGWHSGLPIYIGTSNAGTIHSVTYDEREKRWFSERKETDGHKIKEPITLDTNGLRYDEKAIQELNQGRSALQLVTRDYLSALVQPVLEQTQQQTF